MKDLFLSYGIDNSAHFFVGLGSCFSVLYLATCVIAGALYKTSFSTDFRPIKWTSSHYAFIASMITTLGISLGFLIIAKYSPPEIPDWGQKSLAVIFLVIVTSSITYTTLVALNVKTLMAPPPDAENKFYRLYSFLIPVYIATPLISLAWGLFDVH